MPKLLLHFIDDIPILEGSFTDVQEAQTTLMKKFPADAQHCVVDWFTANEATGNALILAVLPKNLADKTVVVARQATRNCYKQYLFHCSKRTTAFSLFPSPTLELQSTWWIVELSEGKSSEKAAQSDFVLWFPEDRETKAIIFPDLKELLHPDRDFIEKVLPKLKVSLAQYQQQFLGHSIVAKRELRFEDAGLEIFLPSLEKQSTLEQWLAFHEPQLKANKSLRTCLNILGIHDAKVIEDLIAKGWHIFAKNHIEFLSTIIRQYCE